MLKFLSGLLSPKTKTYPVLRADMLQPVDNPINTTEAKRIYREWMLQIGYYAKKHAIDREELRTAVEFFAEEMKSHEEGLKIELQSTKDALKEDLDLCDTAEERSETNVDHQRYIDRDTTALAAFKADKRAWLVEFINRQTQST